MLEIDLGEAAGRTAYLAGFHAAQPLIYEREDRSAKTHNGVHTEFARLMKDDRDIPAQLRWFLSRTYEFKSIADYGRSAKVGVTLAEASEVIADATRFIALVEPRLAAPPP